MNLTTERESAERGGPEEGLASVPIPYRGHELLAQPLLNKDTAFTEQEREVFGLRGLLPPRVRTLEEQVALEIAKIRRKGDELERFIGIRSALRILNEPLPAQRFVFLGAGAASIGIARLVRAQMLRDGAPKDEVRRAIVVLDSQGLTYLGREPLDADKEEFALGPDELTRYRFAAGERYGLEEVVERVGPSFLFGTSGTPGTFTEVAIRQMAAQARIPVILPLSNPTSKTEARPEDILEWTSGRAIVATGSPFPPVVRGELVRVIGQANNAFCFPGIGLGALVAEAREITDEMFLSAAEALAGTVSQARLEEGALYPNQSSLRDASRAVAIEVARAARDCGVGRNLCDDEVESVVDAMMWEPRYLPYEPV